MRSQLLKTRRHFELLPERLCESVMHQLSALDHDLATVVFDPLKKALLGTYTLPQKDAPKALRDIEESALGRSQTLSSL